MSCHIFGHFCPGFFSSEGLSETGDFRNSGAIPFQVKMRVARRDNYQCQLCGELLREYQIEFDHRIPRSLGGTSDEHNIRVTCLKCNRKKGKIFPHPDSQELGKLKAFMSVLDARKKARRRA
jgi:5-methylcytosine-specific restriction endonuclease McrA